MRTRYTWCGTQCKCESCVQAYLSKTSSQQQAFSSREAQNAALSLEIYTWFKIITYSQIILASFILTQKPKIFQKADTSFFNNETAARTDVILYPSNLYYNSFQLSCLMETFLYEEETFWSSEFVKKWLIEWDYLS